MPSYLRGQDRDLLRFVKVYSQGELYYGFNTKDFASLSGYGLSQQEIDVLGHLALDNVPNSGILIFRANAPKPARVKKVINRNPTAEQIGNASTFIAAGQLRAASNEGWKLAVDGRGISLASNDRTVTAVADLSDSQGLYANGMNKNDFDNFGNVLGLESKATLTTEAERRRIFAGTSRPQPPVVSKIPQGGQGRFQSICSASALSDALNDTNRFELKKAEIIFA
jgi:hypothetical protein